MKYTINNVEWEIKEISQKEIKQMQNKKSASNDENIEDTAHRYYGITYNDDCIIYLDKDIKQDRKKKTLLHELTHCYISSYITHQEKQYDEEMVADIVSNSYDIIAGILNQYFKEDKVNDNK